MTLNSDDKKQALIRFCQLSKRYDKRQILKSVDVSFYEAECYLLRGSNGSGKSTLLRVMAGLLKPENGSVSLIGDGMAEGSSWLKRQKSLREHVMYLHQNPYLFDGTVTKNLELALKKSKGIESKEVLIQGALRWSGLEAVASSPAKQLSGGEKQRLALARAKLRNAPILLLDEPTANLDQTSRLMTLELLSSLKHSGVALMIACHEYQEFMSIADGAMNLIDGGLQNI